MNRTEHDMRVLVDGLVFHYRNVGNLPWCGASMQAPLMPLSMATQKGIAECAACDLELRRTGWRTRN